MSSGGKKIQRLKERSFSKLGLPRADCALNSLEKEKHERARNTTEKVLQERKKPMGVRHL